MPFQNGVFKRLFSWQADANAGKGISPVEFDQDGDDVAGALSNTILRDGTGAPVADIPWNGKRITGMGGAQGSGDALVWGGTPPAAITAALGFAPYPGGYFTKAVPAAATLSYPAYLLLDQLAFTAVAPEIAARAVLSCSTSDGSIETVLSYLDLYDDVTHDVFVIGQTDVATASSASYGKLTPEVGFTGLTVGKAYHVRLWVGQSDGDHNVATRNGLIVAENYG